MKFSINKTAKCQVKINIELSVEEFNAFYEKAVLEIGKDLEVKGFRKGRAPKSIIEEKIGLEKILIRAAEMAIKENYNKIVFENNLETISRPEITIQKLAKNNPFVFSVKVFVLPEIKLPDYKSIADEVEKRKVFVEEKEVEESLKWLQKSRAKFTLKDRPAQKGDFVEIEYQSPQIKKAGGGETIKDAFILGEGHFLPGFEEKLIGMKPVSASDGQFSEQNGEKEFSLSLPEKHPLRKYGEKVDLKVKIKSVQEIKLPEINDQFAESLGRFKTLKDLRESIRQGIALEKEEAESLRRREEILEKISEKTRCDVPDILVEREQKRMLEDFKKNLWKKFKVSWEDYLKKFSSFEANSNTADSEQASEQLKKEESKILQSFLPQAEKNVKKLLILREIGKKEKIEVSEEEVLSEVEKILKKYSSPEEARKNLGLDPQELKEYTKEKLKNEKVFAFLERN